MRVLVSGADGFIGQAVVRHLRGVGHDVTGLVYQRPAVGGEHRIDLGAPGSLHPLHGLRFDAVVHAAGVVDQTLPARIHRRVNAEGTRHLVRAASQWQVQHFVHLSSITVYGLKVMGEHRDEQHTRRTVGIPGFPYGSTKAAAERHVEAGDVPFTTLRLPAVFGAGDSFVTKAMVPPLLEGAFDLADGPDRLFTTMWVENTARIVARVLEAGPQRRAFNAGDGQTTWRTFVGTYAEALGVRVSPRPRSGWSALSRMADKDFLFRFTNSYFGAHFVCDAMHEALAPELVPWQPGVDAAVRAFLKRERAEALPAARST